MCSVWTSGCLGLGFEGTSLLESLSEDTRLVTSSPWNSGAETLNPKPWTLKGLG